MKQMASEMHNELEATRNELRRGVLEMPQEAADNTAQMRKVIVDQIEALAELNRIVAHHGRGLDVVTTSRASVQRQEEPVMAAAAAPAAATRCACATPAARRPCRRRTSACRRRAAPKPRRSARRAARIGGRDGWLSDLLNRTDAGGPSGREAPRGRAPASPGQSAGVAVARHRPADGSQSRRRDVGSLSARREQGVHASGSTRPPARRRSMKSPANTAPTATSSRRSTATSPSSSGCSTKSRARIADRRRCAATSPRRPGWSTPCSRMRRDGWDKAQTRSQNRIKRRHRCLRFSLAIIRAGRSRRSDPSLSHANATMLRFARDDGLRCNRRLDNYCRFCPLGAAAAAAASPALRASCGRRRARALLPPPNITRRRVAVEIVHGAADVAERAAAIGHQRAGALVEILGQFADRLHHQVQLAAGGAARDAC